MAVVHDYKCAVHGFFESSEGVCPHGCEEVQLVFLQPVSMKSDRTKHADTTLRTLASDFKMTDIKSSREGDHQQNALLKANNRNFGVQWGNPAQIGQFDLRSIKGEQVQGLASIRDSGVPLPHLRPAVVVRNHENLKVPT